MFDKYTETARRVIFFARYEASKFGGQHIDTEHLLLGVLREDRQLALRLWKSPERIQSIRNQIEKGFPEREKVSTSVDLPLSRECKRVLAFGAEEAKRLNHEHIGPEHFVLGLLHQPECVAAKVMRESGLTAAQVEENVFGSAATGSPSAGPPSATPLSEGYRDLTAEAIEGTLNPLIGREGELERIIQILSRRTRNNAVLIGEAGVGKNALVYGLARRIADGAVPGSLSDRSILAIDASALLSSRPGGKLPEITNRATVLYVRGLFDLAGKGAGWGVLEAMRVLEPFMSAGGVQCIATGTPLGYRLTRERAESLVRHFEVVAVPAPNEEEAIRIVKGVKEQYEKFHGVVIADEAIETSVSASGWFLRGRHLPDRAIDLVDEAGARVKLRYESEPREIVEIRKRLKVVLREMDHAIANHEFMKAREWSDIERTERQNLQHLLDEWKQTAKSNIVQPEDIVETVAARAKVPVAAVMRVLQLREPETLELVARELAGQIPIGGREWAEELATYLAGCSPEEAEKAALAIRAAKTRLDSQQSRNKMGSGA
jgi:ATP-dependent Clp protease ATP-binding subunit ClpC